MDIITPPAHSQEVAALQDAINRMNSAISRAVNAGVSIELTRSCRYHNGLGQWGDQFALTVRDGFDA